MALLRFHLEDETDRFAMLFRPLAEKLLSLPSCPEGTGITSISWLLLDYPKKETVIVNSVVFYCHVWFMTHSQCFDNKVASSCAEG